jgi:hypothetical protein
VEVVKITIYFPKPYPDELLYSVFARFQKHFGNCSSEMIRSLLGNIKSPPTSPHQINRLQGLLDNTSLGACYTTRQLAFQHTFLPFYSAFSGCKAQRKMLDNMVLHDVPINVFGFVGNHVRKISERSNLQFCSECIKSDIKTYGEPYWHRIHQAPGVWVCPWHGIKLRETCPVCYVPFLKTGMQYSCLSDICSNGHYLSKSITDDFRGETWERLINYAREVYNLLTNEFCYEPQFICKLYITKLRELGWIGLKGQMLQASSFGTSFIEYYGYEFLEMLESNIDIKLSYNWLFTMLRQPSSRNFHPLRHLLIIQFLFGSLENVNSANTEYLPFGKGPWLCLNPAASHYRMPVVHDCCIYKGNLGKLHGVFNCECGYKYSRVGPDRVNEDRYRSDHVISYGQVWEKKLGNLVDSQKMSMKEIGIQLKVDEKTVITYNRKRKERENKKITSRSKIDLYQEKYREKIQQIMIETPNLSRRQIINLAAKEYRWLKLHDEQWLMNILPDSRTKVQPYLKPYRNNILNLIKQNTDINRTQIIKLASQEYYWLKMHDREWLMNILPKPEKKERKKVDWKLRDQEFSNLIKIEVENILNMEGKPKRISVNVIFGKFPKIRTFLNNPTCNAVLPETKACLSSLTETIDDYLIRCVRWAARELDRLEENLTEAGIRKLLRIRKTKFSMTVKKYMEEIITDGNIKHLR